MGAAKLCKETPRQRMINMMYIVLTAMLALNVAAEVLEAFRVVDASLTQTIKTVDMKNQQVYSAFEQAFAENATKVGPWKDKADEVKAKTDSLVTKIWNLKQNLVMASGGVKIGNGVRLHGDDPIFINQQGDTIRIKKEDDLNTPSEMMMTQGMAADLKNDIITQKEFLLGIVGEDDPQLRSTLLQELDTSDPPAKVKSGGEKVSWEAQRFDNKPLIAVITLLDKISIDVKNAESHVINYLYGQIDASSFKFNKLGAQVIPNSNIIIQGDEYVAKVFLAAEDTTQIPQIIVDDKPLEMEGGKGIYRRAGSTPGKFKWSGIIKYRTPSGIIQDYPFTQEYQVTEPSFTVAATKMNVFYKGVDNPLSVQVGGVPRENIRAAMTNGKIITRHDSLFVQPVDEDLQGRKTTVSLYASIGGNERLMGTTHWRVKLVPDPVAQVAGISGGTITRSRLQVEDGVAAVLENFDFKFNYKVTQFDIFVTNALGFTNKFSSTSNRFTPEQKAQFKKLISNSYLVIDNIKARGDDKSVRPLKSISFLIQ